MKQPDKLKFRKKRLDVGSFKYSADIYIKLDIHSNDLESDLTLEKKPVYSGVKCDIQTSNGIEYINGVGTTIDYTHKIYLRYFPEHQQKLFLLIHGNVYEVLRMDVINEEKRFICLKCVKKGDQSVLTNLI